MPKFYWGFEYVPKGQKPIGMRYYGFACGGFMIGYWKIPIAAEQIFLKD